jgi:hypothetical protein
MGIDFLDLTFRVEKEFGVRLCPESMTFFCVTRYFDAVTRTFPEGFRAGDCRVRDFVDRVTHAINEQNPRENVDVMIRVRKHIVDCLACDEWMVTPDAWMVGELGMS